MSLFRLSRHVGALVLAVPVVVALTGCGSDDQPRPTSTTTATAKSVYPPVPTAAQLDAQFRSAIDPKLPDSVRTGLVQDGAAFAGALPDLYRSMHEHPHAAYAITDPIFDNRDGTLTAMMRLDRDGDGVSVRSVPVHFVVDDGKWKLSRTDLCGILLSVDYHVPACG